MSGHLLHETTEGGGSTTSSSQPLADSSLDLLLTVLALDSLLTVLAGRFLTLNRLRILTPLFCLTLAATEP
jgi:hypothetical protein